jgi:hypothetical protein
VNQSFKASLDVQLVDAAFYAARRRPDLAVALCAVCVLNVAFFLLSMFSRAQPAIALEQLERIHRELSCFPGWIKPLRAPNIPEYFWMQTTATSIWLAMIAMTLGCLWFSRPAAKQSLVIAVYWWIAVAAVAYALRASAIFVVVLRRVRPAVAAERLQK